MLKQAVSLGMTGSKYVWIIPGDYTSGWEVVSDPSVSCSQPEMQRAVQGSLSSSLLPLSTSGFKTAAGMVSKYPSQLDYGTGNQII